MRAFLLASAAFVFVVALHFAEMALRRWMRRRFERSYAASDWWRLSHGI